VYVFILRKRCAHIIVLMSIIIIIAASFVESVILNKKINVVISAVEVAMSPEQSNLSLSTVSLTRYFLLFCEACSNIKIFHMCVCAWNVTDAFEDSIHLITKASFQNRLEVWVFHECHVLHFFARHRVNFCVGEMLMGPMIGDQFNCLVGGFHVPEIVL
jgi:hypothetical protein